MSKRWLKLCKTVRFVPYGLAVLEKELLPIFSTLLWFLNVVVLTHIGSPTPEMR